jgi:hypothetical protein
MLIEWNMAVVKNGKMNGNDTAVTGCQLPVAGKGKSGCKLQVTENTKYHFQEIQITI